MKIKRKKDKDFWVLARVYLHDYMPVVRNLSDKSVDTYKHILVREICNDVPDNVHYNLMRKTKVMDLYKIGVPLSFIMQMLDHESISTTSDFYAFATLEIMSEAINRSDEEKLWKMESFRKAIYSLD